MDELENGMRVRYIRTGRAGTAFPTAWGTIFLLLDGGGTGDGGRGRHLPGRGGPASRS